MMTIKDLSVSKELDREAMADVRGGLQDFNIDTSAFLAMALNNSDGGIGNVVTGVQVALPISIVTAVDLNLPFSGSSNTAH
jgi:hypothetical protein